MLSACVFALGTSEFMIAGPLPEIADDLAVTIPQAGCLISAFAVGVIVGAPAMASVRNRPDDEPAPPLAAEFTVFRRGRLWVVFGTTALYQAAVIGVVSYIAPLLTDVTGLDARWVPLVQLGFGLGSVVGVMIGGRIADAHPWSTLFGSLAGVVVLLVLVGVFAPVPIVVVGLVVLLGVVAFVIVAPLDARVFALVGGAPTLASAANTSAFNVGNSAGPALGGLAIPGGLGYTAPARLGAGLAAGAIGLGLLSRYLDRTSHTAG